jgi:hypothetical protein
VPLQRSGLVFPNVAKPLPTAFTVTEPNLKPFQFAYVSQSGTSPSKWGRWAGYFEGSVGGFSGQ